MSERLDRDELHALLGAYALGALDEAEREQVEEALLDDADARAELHRLEHAAAWLGHASPRPSQSSWAAVAAEIDRDLAGDAGVVPIGGPRSARWVRPFAAAAVALVMVVGAFALASVLDSGGGSAPVAGRVVVLRLADGRAAARAVLQPDGTGRIRSAEMPDPGAGHTYQAWSITDRGPVSAGVLGAHPVGHRFHTSRGATALAVTIEPTGGSMRPSTEPMASARLQ
jgi:anti-sigma-K factor RskA